jgi:hypothetical protein
VRPAESGTVAPHSKSFANSGAGSPAAKRLGARRDSAAFGAEVAKTRDATLPVRPAESGATAPHSKSFANSGADSLAAERRRRSQGTSAVPARPADGQIGKR